MNAPLVSIALCTYNGERYIEQQLRSILNQTHSRLEVIVSDDGSTDSTLDKITRFKDPRVRIFQNKTNLGLETNFFKAISLCSGQYIALSDQDDIWLLNKIEVLLNHIDGNTLAYGNSAFVNEEGRPTGKKLSDLRRMYSGSDNRVFTIPFVTFLFGHAILFDSRIKGALLQSPPKIYHDGWIGFVAASEGRIQYVGQVLVHYRQHASSVTSKSKKSKTELRPYLTTWFTQLASYPGEKNRNFFKRLLILFKKGTSLHGAVNLFLILIMTSKTLFFTKKKILSRLNLIRKLFR